MKLTLSVLLKLWNPTTPHSSTSSSIITNTVHSNTALLFGNSHSTKHALSVYKLSVKKKNQRSVPCLCLLIVKWINNMHVTFTTNLIAFEVGTSAGSKTLFAAEALELWAHAERVALYPFLLAPDTHNLHILNVVHCRGKSRRGFRVIIYCNLRW